MWKFIGKSGGPILFTFPRCGINKGLLLPPSSSSPSLVSMDLSTTYIHTYNKKVLRFRAAFSWWSWWRQCTCVSVTSHHIAVMHVMHQEALANQNETQQHLRRHDVTHGICNCFLWIFRPLLLFLNEWKSTAWNCTTFISNRFLFRFFIVVYPALRSVFFFLLCEAAATAAACDRVTDGRRPGCCFSSSSSFTTIS